MNILSNVIYDGVRHGNNYIKDKLKEYLTQDSKNIENIDDQIEKILKEIENLKINNEINKESIIDILKKNQTIVEILEKNRNPKKYITVSQENINGNNSIGNISL